MIASCTDTAVIARHNLTPPEHYGEIIAVNKTITVAEHQTFGNGLLIESGENTFSDTRYPRRVLNGGKIEQPLK